MTSCILCIIVNVSLHEVPQLVGQLSCGVQFLCVDNSQWLIPKFRSGGDWVHMQAMARGGGGGVWEGDVPPHTMKHRSYSYD